MVRATRGRKTSPRAPIQRRVTVVASRLGAVTSQQSQYDNATFSHGEPRASCGDLRDGLHNQVPRFASAVVVATGPMSVNDDWGVPRGRATAEHAARLRVNDIVRD